MSKDQPKNQSKIKSKVRELAKKQGITSSYGLMKRLNVAPTVAVNLWNDDVTRFSVETLQLLCEKLMCEVGELLVYESNAKRSKPVAVPESVKGESVKVEDKSTVDSDILIVDSSELKTITSTEMFDHLKKSISGKVFNNSILEIVNSSSDNEILLSTADVAQRLGINERTVRDNYNNGKLPFVKRGTKNLVKESDFIAFRDSRNST
jgi:excisionase family DNA binding protein